MKTKKLSDYYDAVCEKFPQMPRKDIERLLVHGMRCFYVTNLYGGDVMFKTPGFFMYCGRIFKNVLENYKYWKLKAKIKVRYQNALKKEPFDGYYYFGLTEKQYLEELFPQLPDKHKRGNRRKKFTLHNIMLYRIQKESFLDEHKKYQFKVYLGTDIGLIHFVEEFQSKHISLVAKRDENKKLIMLDNE